MWALDLFSGTGSVKKVLEKHGYKVVTLDVDPYWGADIQEDVLKVNFKKVWFPTQFDIVFASPPPCVEYSTTLSIRPKTMIKVNSFVQRTLKIIDYLKPRLWFLENPFFGKLAEQPYMKNIAHIRLDYCKFSDFGYQKPTCFWGTVNKLQNFICKRDCVNMVGPDYVRHKMRLGRFDEKTTSKENCRDLVFN